MLVVEEIRLNLGSRDRIIPGFKNMDLELHKGVHYVGDVSDLSGFEDNSVMEIFASNILEHFPHTETLKVLSEWRRVLKTGSRLCISVPDFSRTVEIYRETGLKDWIENFICGDQSYPTAFHYAIFDENRLTEKLESVGFRDICTVEKFPFSAKEDCSNIVSNLDNKPVCLNMIAVK